MRPSGRAWEPWPGTAPAVRTRAVYIDKHYVAMWLLQILKSNYNADLDESTKALNKNGCSSCIV